MGLVNGFRLSRPPTDIGSRAEVSPVTEQNVRGVDDVGFGALYDANIDALWRLLERLGVPSSVIDDAAQDVFVIAYRRRAEFRGDSTLRTWLTGIALRVAKDYRRSRSRRGEYEPIEQAHHLETGRRPDEDAIANQALNHVLSLAAQLE